jgi:spore coat protein A, manganese oxidase
MGLVLPLSSGRRALAQTLLLDAVGHPQFVSPLPRPAAIDATRGGRLNVAMREATQFLGLFDPATGRPLTTTVWGYSFRGPPTYPGATIVARRGRPLGVMWQNQLKEEREPWQAHLLPVDTSVHLATPERQPKPGVPLVTHLHGGHTESASDGLPEAWFTKNFKETGAQYVKQVYRYDNDQEAGTLWYHDHALGITRLNVYAGLAGFYLLRDDNEQSLIDDGTLPGGPYEVGLAIQDRMFTADGQLFLPSDPNDPNLDLPPGAPDPSIVAEFFGDFILVNGMAWPVLDVEPRKYRFRVLNGSDSRFYVLEFRDHRDDGSAQPFLQIGTDLGLLAMPVGLSRLVLAPGERADLIVDFGALYGSEIFLRNLGPDDPFRGLNADGTPSDGEGGALDPADPATTGQVMKFRVSQELSSVPEASVDAGTALRDAPIADLGAPTTTRQLVLFEGEDEFGRLRPQLGTLEEGSLLWDDPVTENPGLGDVEVWEVFNATEDAHPIHLHLVAFQILNRQGFDGEVETEMTEHHGTKQYLTDVELLGDARDPEPNERGWKDTAVMLPGEMTRIIARFDRPGRYVWHCHILSHEDHEMMRPYHVGAGAG